MVKALKIKYVTNHMPSGERIPSYIVYIPERDVGIDVRGKKAYLQIGEEGNLFEFMCSRWNAMPEEIEVTERYVELIHRIYQSRRERLIREDVLAA